MQKDSQTKDADGIWHLFEQFTLSGNVDYTIMHFPFPLQGDPTGASTLTPSGGAERSTAGVTAPEAGRTTAPVMGTGRNVLSKGAEVGIIVGCIIGFFLLAIATIGVFCWRRRGRNENPPGPADHATMSELSGQAGMRKLSTGKLPVDTRNSVLSELEEGAGRWAPAVEMGTGNTLGELEGDGVDGEVGDLRNWGGNWRRS